MKRNEFSETSPGYPSDPSKVLSRKDLTFDGKVALLKNWQLDLTERMTATNENMGGTRDEGQIAEQFRAVSRALSMLEQEQSER